jgi:hypothetical protein
LSAYGEPVAVASSLSSGTLYVAVRGSDSATPTYELLELRPHQTSLR